MSNSATKALNSLGLPLNPEDNINKAGTQVQAIAEATTTRAVPTRWSRRCPQPPAECRRCSSCHSASLATRINSATPVFSPSVVSPGARMNQRLVE